MRLTIVSAANVSGYFTLNEAVCELGEGKGGLGRTVGGHVGGWDGGCRFHWLNLDI